MKGATLYIKAEQNTEILNKKIFLGDVVKLLSTDKNMTSELSKTVFMVVTSKENCKYTVSIMKIIEIIQKQYPDVEIVNLGETDFVISHIIPEKKKKYYEYIKAGIVALTIFFGAAFTMMTFNTDVSVSDVFDNIYRLFMGDVKYSGSILEIAYSVGLPLGVLIFFNHFSRKKIHNDPTPIQIQMRVYEEDLNKTLIQDASREGKNIDAD